MKNILKLMLVFTLGVFLLSSCSEGDTSMPDMNDGAIKNLQSIGDPLIIVDNPGSFDGAISLEVKSLKEVGSVDLSVIFVNSTGANDTAFVMAVTSFPYELNFDQQWFADQFPAWSNYILNSLVGGDNFTFITGNIIMADGTEIFDDYEFEVQAVSETTGNDTIITIDADGRSAALVNIQGAVWFTEFTYYVGCPFDPAEAAGTYEIVQENWWEESYGPSLTGRTVEVTAGPGANQITIHDPFKFDEDFGSGPYPVIVEVDPAGFIFATVARQNVCHFDATAAPQWNWGYGPGFVQGGGLALSCIGVIDLNWELTVAAGSFGGFSYKLQKQ